MVLNLIIDPAMTIEYIVRLDKSLNNNHCNDLHYVDKKLFSGN